MPIPIIYAGYAVATTAGRIALPVLAKEFAKRGGTQFIKTYGKAAFQAVTGGTAGAVAYDQTINKSSIPQSSMPDATRMEQMDASMAVPNLYKDTGINKSVAETGQGIYIGDTGQKEKERARIAEENKERMKGSTPPVIKTWEESYPDQSGEIIDSSPPPSVPEPIKIPQETFPDLSDELNKPQILYKDDSEFKYPTTEEIEGHIKEENKFWEEEIIPRENKKYPKLNIKNLPKIVEADKHFGAAAMGFEGFKESQLIYMSPQEYLDLTKRFRPEKQGATSKLNSDNIEKVLKDGKELANIPFLNVKKVGDSYEITGQEGIHRAIAFKNLGYDKIPVVIQGTGTDPVAKIENKVYTATPKSYLYNEAWAKDYIGFIPKSIQSDGEVLLTKPEDFYNVRTKEKLFVKDSIAKQTDKLVPEKVELGPLSAVEKQTAIALKGDKPDYYSRIVQAIKDTKQNKMPKEQWASIINKSGTKTEIGYLGLEDFSKSKESITKEELLKSIKDKDITSNLVLVSVPKEDQLDFSNLSIGGAGNTTRQYVLQLNKDPKSLGEIEFNRPERLFQDTTAHFIEKYGANSMGHTRAQIGFDPSEDAAFANLSPREQVLKITNPVIKNATEKLKNTFIVDEYQSPWIQQIQKKGIAKDWVVIKGSNMKPDFIQDNYEDLYDLRIARFQTQKDLLENTGMSTNKVLYRIDKKTGDTHVEKRIEDDLYYVFSKEKLESTLAFQEKEQAEDFVNSAAPPDLPIKTTKEYFKILYAGMIKEAIKAGADSIGITNGQIQGDRYEGQDPEKAEGLKKAYKEIFYPLVVKQAKQDGVENLIEAINIRESEPSEQEEIRSIPNRMKMAMQNGMVLKKIRGDILYATVNDVTREIPDHFAIYGSQGRAQGHSGIMDVIENDRPNVIEMGAGEIDNPAQYFIWVKAGSALSETLSNRPNDMYTLKDYFDNSTVDYSMPLVIVNPEDNRGGTSDMTSYSDFILNYKNKGIDLSYEHDEHQIIKVPLPKKLQKDILSKPIKLSKVKTQPDRLTA